jgi:hypothetical protein
MRSRIKVTQFSVSTFENVELKLSSNLILNRVVLCNAISMDNILVVLNCIKLSFVSCQVSNVTLVEVGWIRFYSSMEA